MKEKHIDIFKRFEIGVLRGASKALAEHKLKGVPIAIEENGKIKIIPPEEIVVPPYPELDEDC